MSAAAVMLIKDESDVIEHVLHHLAAHVDEIYVADNGSSDGTREILDEIELPVPLTAADDPEVGYFQSRKTTELAMLALADGHSWVIPCDADEVWYVSAEPERRIADYLAGMSPDVQIVNAELYHHIPSALDPAEKIVTFEANLWIIDEEAHIATSKIDAMEIVIEPNPFRRIGWRKRERAGLPKVACRLRPDLVIEPGNHGAKTDGTALRAGGLTVRHFSWRSEQQYLRKIRNGEAAYAATDLPANVGEHWRGWADKSDEAIIDHFRCWFYSSDPEADDSLVYDPVTPFLRGSEAA